MKWRKAYTADTEYDWNDGWVGTFLDVHSFLFESFIEVLSPTEAMFVLMHALSSDTRVIYAVVVSLFFAFTDGELDGGQEGTDQGQHYALDLIERLRRVSYTLEDSEFTQIVDTILADASKKRKRMRRETILALIANYFGWKEVSKRRYKVVKKHLNWRDLVTKEMWKKAPTALSS